jgi:hypothetical protein
MLKLNRLPIEIKLVFNRLGIISHPEVILYVPLSGRDHCFAWLENELNFILSELLVDLLDLGDHVDLLHNRRWLVGIV